MARDITGSTVTGATGQPTYCNFAKWTCVKLPLKYVSLYPQPCSQLHHRHFSQWTAVSPHTQLFEVQRISECLTMKSVCRSLLSSLRNITPSSWEVMMSNSFFWHETAVIRRNSNYVYLPKISIIIQQALRRGSRNLFIPRIETMAINHAGESVSFLQCSYLWLAYVLGNNSNPCLCKQS